MRTEREIKAKLRMELAPSADLRKQLDEAMQLILALTAANQALREECDKYKRQASALLNLGGRP